MFRYPSLSLFYRVDLPPDMINDVINNDSRSALLGNELFTIRRTGPDNGFIDAWTIGNKPDPARWSVETYRRIRIDDGLMQREIYKIEVSSIAATVALRSESEVKEFRI